MYITVRAFRNYGTMMPIGVIVEPTQIRRIKNKIREGKIAIITEENKKTYEAIISHRLGEAFTIKTAKKYDGEHYGLLMNKEAEAPKKEEPKKVVTPMVEAIVKGA